MTVRPLVLLTCAAMACGVDATVLHVAVPPAVIVAGEYQTLVVRSEGVYLWGDQTFAGSGQSTDARSAPVRVLAGSGWMSPAAGDGHACAVRSGELWCWGQNTKHALGIEGEGVAVPMRVAGLPPIATVGTGTRHTIAVDTTGAVWTWGDNDYGGCGIEPILADVPVPTRPPWGGNWTTASGGDYHSCGLQAGGRLLCWGLTASGRAGLGSTPPAAHLLTPTEVDGGGIWSVMDQGELDGCGIRSSGELLCWGDGGYTTSPQPSPTPVNADRDWVSVSTHVFERCAIKRDGSLWCWGRNVEGQLGVGDNTDRTEPTRVGPDRRWRAVAVGRFHMCALAEDDSVWCAGMNLAGQLGTGSVFDGRNTLERVTMPSAAHASSD